MEDWQNAVVRQCTVVVPVSARLLSPSVHGCCFRQCTHINNQCTIVVSVSGRLLSPSVDGCCLRQCMAVVSVSARLLSRSVDGCCLRRWTAVVSASPNVSENNNTTINCVRVSGDTCRLLVTKLLIITLHQINYFQSN